jgi:hypothetical protein
MTAPVVPPHDFLSNFPLRSCHAIHTLCDSETKKIGRKAKLSAKDNMLIIDNK